MKALAVHGNELFAATSTEQVYHQSLSSLLRSSVRGSESWHPRVTISNNPSRFETTIHIPDVPVQQVDFYSLQGIRIQTLQSPVTTSEGATFIWNTSEVPAGTYFLLIRLPNSTERATITIVH
jgi:hypothetical protein